MSDSDSFDDPFSSWLSTLTPEKVERERCVADADMLVATEAVSLGVKYRPARTPIASNEAWERIDAERFIAEQAEKYGDPVSLRRAKRNLREFETRMRRAGYKVTRKGAA